MPKQNIKTIDKMEQAVFALGAPRRETKQQKKERLRKEKEWKYKDARAKKRKLLYKPLPKREVWCILPKHVTNGFDFWIETLKGRSFFEKRKSLFHSLETQPPVKPCPWNFNNSTHLRQEFLEKSQLVISLLHQNQALRWKFKNFFTKARMLRFQKVNEQDPITLEPFKQPIRIYNFYLQKTYVFEAESCAKHIHKKLTQNDGHIPTPQCPKNPLTNQDFSLTQLMSVIQQCKQAGHTFWSIEAFKACRYDPVSFIAVHSKPLRLHALHMTMASPTSWDCIDTLYDFIKSQHEEHNEHFSVLVYKWAIHHVPHEERIEKWKKLCIKWYEVDILFDDTDTQIGFFNEIQKKTLPLCKPPKELLELRSASLKSQQQADGSSNT